MMVKRETLVGLLMMIVSVAASHSLPPLSKSPSSSSSSDISSVHPTSKNVSSEWSGSHGSVSHVQQKPRSFSSEVTIRHGFPSSVLPNPQNLLHELTTKSGRSAFRVSRSGWSTNAGASSFGLLSSKSQLALSKSSKLDRVRNEKYQGNLDRLNVVDENPILDVGEYNGIPK